MTDDEWREWLDRAGVPMPPYPWRGLGVMALVAAEAYAVFAYLTRGLEGATPGRLAIEVWGCATLVVLGVLALAGTALALAYTLGRLLEAMSTPHEGPWEPEDDPGYVLRDGRWPGDGE
jgi:hypothetical protein